MLDIIGFVAGKNTIHFSVFFAFLSGQSIRARPWRHVEGILFGQGRAEKAKNAFMYEKSRIWFLTWTQILAPLPTLRSPEREKVTVKTEYILMKYMMCPDVYG